MTRLFPRPYWTLVLTAAALLVVAILTSCTPSPGEPAPRLIPPTYVCTTEQVTCP